MAKKDKKGKKGGYDWDDEEDTGLETTAVEFGATPESAGSEAPAESTESPAADATAESPADGESPAPESSEPQAASMDDIAEEFGGLMGALNKSKKKKVAKEEAKAAEAREAEESAIQVKSKKEKEREKKEREKLKKKQQAEAKKNNQKAMNAALEIEREKAKALAQKMREEALQSAADESEKKVSAAAAKKKKTGASSALQKKLVAQREAAEAQKKAEEEEQKRIADEEAKQAEEERLKEEARQKKKEKAKAKREELRKDGKLLTKKQKEQIRIAELRRKQLLESSNIKVEALSKGETPKHKVTPLQPIYQDKRPQSNDSTSTASSTPAPSELPISKPVAPVVVEIKEEKKEEAVPEEEEPILESWENALDSDEDANEEDDTEEEKAAAAAAAAAAAKAKADAEKAKAAAAAKAKESESESADGPSDLEKALSHAQKNRAAIEKKAEERLREAQSQANEQNLRSPICCILGHVDHGKTLILDKIRQSNVQEGEAGGITQQIGATYFPIDAIQKKTEVMKKYVKVEYNVPGLLVIDTPGHESFSNLRTRGSSLCNIAILVIDITQGLEKQTLESIKLLRERKTPFIVALNKIDRCYGWEATPNNAFRDSLARQSSSVQREFQDRYEQAKLALAEQGLNSELYYQNKNMSKYVSIVPTSAVTGEGIPDLLYLLLELTQSRMSKQLMYLSTLEATILEVKVVEGFGTTIDVVLSNGILREGDRIVLCGQNGPIVTQVRALLTPQPLRELRIKSSYIHNKEVKAALGVKIAANDLDKAVAGSRLLLIGPDDDEEELMDEVMDDLTGLLDSVDKTGQGICVQASTLGSLEALLDFLKEMKIPVMSMGIGPVFKRDIMRATTMLEKRPDLALMLCFDVKVDREAEQYAQDQGIKIFSANVIYHLFDEFTKYQNMLLEKKREENAALAIYPCVCKTLQIINKRNPMIIGLEVVSGSIRIGTPISVVKADPATGTKQILDLGRIQSMEVNHKSTEIVKKGQTNQGVAVRLSDPNSAQPIWGRHVDEKDQLYSHITRKSIDILKDPAFRDSVSRDDWLLIKNLKPLFDIK